MNQNHEYQEGERVEFRPDQEFHEGTLKGEINRPPSKPEPWYIIIADKPVGGTWCIEEDDIIRVVGEVDG